MTLSYFDEWAYGPAETRNTLTHVIMLTLGLFLLMWVLAITGGVGGTMHHEPKAPYAVPYCDTGRGVFGPCVQGEVNL